MAYSFLSDLNNSRDDWMIQVRICRLWNSVNTKKNGELISLDMILIDEKEDLMHAVIRKHQVKKYRPMLSEGSIFVIKNFKVTENVASYRPLSSEFKIIFFVTTSLKRIDESIISIPTNGFEFINSEMVDARVNDNTVLSDVIGCLCGIGEMETVGGKWRKRDIEIITDYSVKAKVTLWEDFGEKFYPYLYNKDGEPYIVIVTSTAVKEFKGEISFSTTSATKMYVNLEIDYVSSLVEKFAATSKGIQPIESSIGNNISPEEEMFFNRMKIKELLECDWSAELQEYVCTVRATITDLDNRWGWFYVSCNSCKKKVKPVNGLYTCPICDKECKLPLVMYKVHVIVKDNNGETTFVLFNPIAEKLLDTSAHKLFNKLALVGDDVPEQLKCLCGKDFIFKLKLNSYNLKDGDENFTVTKLLIPNDELELQYTNRKKDTGKTVMVVGNEPHQQVANGGSQHKELDNKLEDSEGDQPVVSAFNKRKRRNVVIDDDEVSDEDTTKCKK